MKGDKLEDRIKAAQLIVEHGTCRGVLEVCCGVLEVCCLPVRLPKGMLPCPNRTYQEPGWVCSGKDIPEAEAHRVASAKAFLARHASPVTPDPASVGQDAQGEQKAQERETIQGPRFDTTREKSKEEKE